MGNLTSGAEKEREEGSRYQVSSLTVEPNDITPLQRRFDSLFRPEHLVQSQLVRPITTSFSCLVT